MLGTRRGSERPTTGQSQGAGRPTLPSAPTDQALRQFRLTFPSAPTDQALRQFHLTFSSAPTDHAPRHLLVVSQRAQTGFPRRRLTPLGFGGSAGLRKSGVAAGSTRSGWHKTGGPGNCRGRAWGRRRQTGFDGQTVPRNKAEGQTPHRGCLRWCQVVILFSFTEKIDSGLVKTGSGSVRGWLTDNVRWCSRCPGTGWL